MITDWLMVIITAIYVGATIFIYHANSVSAKATRDQLEESKRQFEETKRLEMMPCLSLEDGNTFCYDLKLVLDNGDLEDGGVYCHFFKIENIGNGAAKDISYKWTNATATYPQKPFPVLVLQSGGRKDFRFCFAYPKNTKNTSPIIAAQLEFSFHDLLERSYTQNVELFFTLSSHKIELEYVTKPPKQIKEQQKINYIQH